MDYCDTHGLMPIETAMEKLLDAANPVVGIEKVALSESLGRVLSESVKSDLNVPPHDNSGMDGFALRAADLSDGDELMLVGQSFAGHPFEGVVGRGECVRIMTGAVMPEGADCVVMQERTEVEGERVRFSIKPPVGDNIRRAGEDVACGDIVLYQGRQITAADIGLLASLGISEVVVFRKVTVALFSTGDELKKPGEVLGAGDIYESNRYSVAAMMSRLGVEVIDLGIVPDDKEKLREVFAEADQRADVVISSGGVSVGEADYTKDILEELGRVGFWKLAIKPGKPFAFGQLPYSYFMGLPGNPVSAMVTFHQLAVPFVRKLMGQNHCANPAIQARLATHIRKRPGRTDYQRGIFSIEEGEAVVCTTGSQGSGILSSMSVANCYIIVPRDCGNVEAGEMVDVELFDSLVGSI